MTNAGQLTPPFAVALRYIQQDFEVCARDNRKRIWQIRRGVRNANDISYAGEAYVTAETPVHVH